MAASAPLSLRWPRYRRVRQERDVPAITGDGKEIVLRGSAIVELDRRMRGDVLLAETEGYDEARRVLAAYDNMADMIRLGAYRAGADAEVDRAIKLFPKLEAFLRQAKDECGELQTVYEQLAEILNSEA